MGRGSTVSCEFGREIILGLLAEEPSCSYQLDRRLAERFSSADYTNGMANKMIMRLLEVDLERPSMLTRTWCLRLASVERE